MADHDELSGVRHFRDRRAGGEQRATTLELFFDLVFVFAITQLSHLLLDHLTWTGALQTLFLLLVVWWGWNYTTWMTNFVDPDSPPVRVVLLVVMLASLLMSIAIPEAFGDRAPLFAISYVALQVIRNAFIAWATPARQRGRGAPSAASSSGRWPPAPCSWRAPSCRPPPATWCGWSRWCATTPGPAARYWVPGRAQQVTTADWTVDTATSRSASSCSSSSPSASRSS